MGPLPSPPHTPSQQPGDDSVTTDTDTDTDNSSLTRPTRPDTPAYTTVTGAARRLTVAGGGVA